MAVNQKYQLWWTDDRGNRLFQIDEWSFMTYSRLVNGIGTLDIGMPLAVNSELAQIDGENWAYKDYRIEIWRAPVIGAKKRLESIFWMQTPIIRTRDDGVTIFEMVGHDAVGMLRRRRVKYKAGTSQSRKTASVDDMMKEIVDENMGAAAYADDPDRALPYNAGQFQVQADASAGASRTKSFAYQNMLDVLKDLAKWTRENGPKIDFDVVPITTTLFEFQTFTNQRGIDRRQSRGKSNLVFSIENGNLRTPRLVVEAFEEENVIYGGGQGTDSSREVQEAENTDLTSLSLWARKEGWRDARNQTTAASVLDAAQEELGYKKPNRKFAGELIDAPGARYGVDWDLGDRVTANYGGQVIDPEVRMVYVSVNEDGLENVNGRQEFASATAAD